MAKAPPMPDLAMAPVIARAATILLAAALGACAGTQADVQRSVDQSVLRSFVGRDYAEVTRALPVLPLQPVQEPPFGHRFATTELPDGSRLHRHLIRGVARESRVNVLGLAGSTERQFSYRLLYFRVGRDGLVTDTANGFVMGEGQRCVGYLGGLFRTCENAQALAADITFFDAQVRTSDGRPISAWLPAAEPVAPVVGMRQTR